MTISLRALQHSYASTDGARLPALGPLSLDIAEDEFVCLLGPSGCGKSTLIRIVAGLTAPTAGQALYKDAPITAPLDDFAIMFQDANLLPWRSVLDNVALPLELAGMSRVARHKIVRDLLPQLGLAGFEKAYPAELSGGMAQRAALGRVIAQNPRVWLLDEPFGALDALTREKLGLELLRLRAQSRQTILMVTHDINEAVLLADRVIVLSPRPGRVVADIAIDLPRPRKPDMFYAADFSALARQVRSAIETPRETCERTTT